LSIEIAYRLFFTNKIDEAKKLVKRIVQKSPSSKAFFLFALIHYNEGLYNEAFWAVDKALELDDSYYEAWILKSHILRKMGRYQAALDCLDKAFDIQYKLEDYVDYEIYVLKARIYLEMGKVQDAIKILDIAKKINPMDEEILELSKQLRRRTK